MRARIHCVGATAVVGAVAISVHGGGDWEAVSLHPTWGGQPSGVNALAGGQQGGFIQQWSDEGIGFAAIWSGAAETLIELHSDTVHPQYSAASEVHAMTETAQGGAVYAYCCADNPLQPAAAMWNGTPESFTLLHPDPHLNSMVLALDGNAQAGWVKIGADLHASVWHGTAESWEDIHPTGNVVPASTVLGMADRQQVGMIFDDASGLRWAGLWEGTPESFRLLHPSGASGSRANATDGVSQGGSVGFHAVMWFGTAESLVDLHPTWASSSSIAALIPGYQVGSVGVAGATHAAIWAGSAASAVDLHQYLPPGEDWSYSYATAVAIDRGYLLVGGTTGCGFECGHAILWKLRLGVPGDVTGDDIVSVDDLLAVLAAWGPCADCPEDLDGSGSVDVGDLLEVLGNWS